MTTFKNHQVDDGLLCELTEKVLCDDFWLTPFNASKLPKLRRSRVVSRSRKRDLRMDVPGKTERAPGVRRRMDVHAQRVLVRSDDEFLSGSI